MFDRFTDDSKRTMNLARQEAHLFHHEYLGTEHILLGLLQQSDCTAVLVLKQLGIEPVHLRAEIEKLVEVGKPSGPIVQIPFTPRAKKVLELSMEEAQGLRHTCIGTGHLLLGLLGEREGVGGQALRARGVTLERARTQVLELRGESYEDGSRIAPAQKADDRARVIDRLRFASAILQRMGEPEAARKIAEIVVDLQSRS
jgi:ATP-dependent Clp protease ATP-binding subunit ClpC